jgi:hypothetical protein
VPSVPAATLVVLESPAGGVITVLDIAKPGVDLFERC